jgi:hypothetical protein
VLSGTDKGLDSNGLDVLYDRKRGVKESPRVVV